MPKQQRYDRSDIRRLNAVSVVNQLRLNGALSRANIAAELGLTRATVSNIVADLLSASLVSETEYAEGRAGRPGLLIELNPEFGCMVAVEIDLDCISIVLSNVGLKTLWSESLPLDVAASPEVVLKKAVKLIERGLKFGEEQELSCLGICVAWAGFVDSKAGRLEYGPTSGWENIPLKKMWESHFDVPVYVQNEAHAGAIGAHHFGATQGSKDLIYLSLGVGLAAGIFSEGVLLRGNQGFAGQVGHTLFADNQITCSCGKTGCWVTEVGASALLRKLKAVGVEIPGKRSGDVDLLESIYEKAVAGESKVLEVLHGVGAQVGKGLASIVQTFNPSELIVGGRMGKLMQLVETSVTDALNAETLEHMSDSLRVTISDSGEDHLQGCLATVYDALMTNPIPAPAAATATAG